MPVSFRFHRNRVGAHGCTIGLAPWAGVIGYADSPSEALHNAAGIASDLSAVLEEHPALRAVLPPGTHIALKGISAASQALSEGHTIEHVSKALGPATARVVADLLKVF